MSLLLEALKKAEKAKEEAKRQAEAGGERAAGSSSNVPDAPDKHVVTRDELPDISQPLEIVSEDITPRASPAYRPAHMYLVMATCLLLTLSYREREFFQTFF